MKPIVAILRRSGISLVIYLDDILFMNSYRPSVGHFNSKVFIRKLWFYNKLKQISIGSKPESTIPRISSGYPEYDTFFSQGKVTAFKDLCSQMLYQKELNVRDVAQLQHVSQPQSCMSRGIAVVDSTPKCLQ